MVHFDVPDVVPKVDGKLKDVCMGEYFFNCPYCWEKISMLLDISVSGQSYIEDCETCCNPIQIDYTTLEGEIAYFEANSIEQ
jgi:transcription elongation factor Elf1